MATHTRTIDITQTEYRTRDLALATLFVVKGYEVVRIEGSNGDDSRCFFVFHSDDEMYDLVDAYLQGQDEAKVDPQTFIGSVSKMKAAMFAFLDGQRKANGRR